MEKPIGTPKESTWARIKRASLENKIPMPRPKMSETTSRMAVSKAISTAMLPFLEAQDVVKAQFPAAGA